MSTTKRTSAPTRKHDWVPTRSWNAEGRCSQCGALCRDSDHGWLYSDDPGRLGLGGCPFWVPLDKARQQCDGKLDNKAARQAAFLATHVGKW